MYSPGMKFITLLFFTLLFYSSVSVYAAQNIFELLLQNKPMMTADKMGELLRDAVPGDTFPALTEIPDTSFSCANIAAPGFYSDTETNCQVFRRCDLNGIMSSFLCTPGTVFNQLTLTCDWWFNVDCNKAKSFYDFANSRLYLDNGTPLFDSPPPSWQAPVVDIQAPASSSGNGKKTQSFTGSPVTKRKVRSFKQRRPKPSSFFNPEGDI